MDRVGTANNDRKIQTPVNLRSSTQASMASDQDMAAVQIQRNIEGLEEEIRRLFAVARNSEHGPPDTVRNDILRLSVCVVSRQISIDCSNMFPGHYNLSHSRALQAEDNSDADSLHNQSSY